MSHIQLAVNLAPDTAAALQRVAERRGVNITTAIRDAIAYLAFFDDVIAAGDEPAVIEHRCCGDRVREVITA